MAPKKSNSKSAGNPKVPPQPAKFKPTRSSSKAEEAKSKQTSKAAKLEKKASKYDFDENPQYIEHLEAVTKIVRTYGGLGKTVFTPSSRFQDDLGMDEGDIGSVHSMLELEFCSKIDPEDKDKLHCCVDMAKHFCYAKEAKQATIRRAMKAAGLKPDSAILNPGWWAHPMYQAHLRFTTDLVKQISGKQDEVTPLAYFDLDLGMSLEDIFVLFYHLEREICKELKLTLDGETYNLLCCQDVADYITASQYDLFEKDGVSHREEDDDLSDGDEDDDMYDGEEDGEEYSSSDGEEDDSCDEEEDGSSDGEEDN